MRILSGKTAKTDVWKQNRNNAKNIVNSLPAGIHENKRNAAGSSKKVVHSPGLYYTFMLLEQFLQKFVKALAKIYDTKP